MRDDDAVLTGWYTGEVGGEALFLALSEAPPESVEEFLSAPA
ncbi:MAG: hypothetical protein QOD56_1772 [Gammaproteobacteria bacterium]|nr:hypothetical protein [Gammaproteobacteria bacterium]